MEPMLTYKDAKNKPDVTRVFLEGSHVGDIVPQAGGFAYRPKGMKKLIGETFSTVAEVKKSIEGS